MASRTLPGLGLNGFWTLGEAWKSGGDENWLKLSVMAQLVVESATTALPASPANGVVYIAPGSDPNAGKVAVRDAGAWVYFTAPAGTVAWVKDQAGTDKRKWFDGTAWVSMVFGILQSWQDVTALRTPGTTYTNTTGRAILAAITGNSQAISTSALAMKVNDGWASVNYLTHVAGGNGCQNIVPAGSTYMYYADGHTSVVIKEYR